MRLAPRRPKGDCRKRGGRREPKLSRPARWASAAACPELSSLIPNMVVIRHGLPGQSAAAPANGRARGDTRASRGRIF